MKAKVRQDIGAIASLAGATVVKQLPKTRSGKARTQGKAMHIHMDVVYLYIYISTCIYIYMYVYIDRCIHIYVNIYTHINIYIYICMSR